MKRVVGISTMQADAGMTTVYRFQIEGEEHPVSIMVSAMEISLANIPAKTLLLTKLAEKLGVKEDEIDPGVLRAMR